MRVTTVQVERRKSDGNYGNRMMLLSAEIAEGEEPDAALDALAALVQERIEQWEQADEQRREAYRQKQLAQYRAEQEEAERRRREARERAPDLARVTESDPFAEGDEDEDDGPDLDVPEM